MTASKAAADTEKVPIEKIDSATRAPEPLEKAAADNARAAGSSTVPFQPPGDTPGVAPNPNAPTPPPYDNTYAFTIFLQSDLVNPYLGGPCNHLGQTIRVVAPNVQAAYQAVKAQYGATLLKLIGPCPVFVGADHAMSQAAGASAPMQSPHPLQSESKHSQGSGTNPRKSHSSWD